MAKTVDLHLATEMRHIHRFCNMDSDIIALIYVVDALNANGGINNNFVDLV